MVDEKKCVAMRNEENMNRTFYQLFDLLERFSLFCGGDGSSNLWQSFHSALVWYITTVIIIKTFFSNKLMQDLVVIFDFVTYTHLIVWQCHGCGHACIVKSAAASCCVVAIIYNVILKLDMQYGLQPFYCA